MEKTADNIEKNALQVYIMPLTDYDACKTGLKNVYPEERKKELEACKNKEVFIQKYSGWRLLALALLHCTGREINSFSFIKNAYGKWLSDSINLSLTNTKSAVCVALSPFPVGVDMENCEEFYKRLTNEKGERLKELICRGGKSGTAPVAIWTQKESAFKLLGEGTFYPDRIKAEEAMTWFLDLSFGKFCISVSGDGNKKTRFFTVEKDGEIFAKNPEI